MSATIAGAMQARGSRLLELSAVDFAILLLAVLSVSMAYGVTLPVLPFLLERVLGPGNAAAVAQHTGWLTSAYTFALVFMSPVWGLLSDRIDRRAVMAIGLLGSAAALFLLDRASGLAAIYVARIASGILSAAVLPAALAYVAESTASPNRPRKFAITASATTLGFMLGPVIGSWLSPMIISPPQNMVVARIFMLDSPFFLTALVNLIAACALAALPASDKASADAALTRKTSADAWGKIRRALLLTGIVVFGISAAEVGITLLGKQSLALGPQAISAFFVVCSVVMIIVQIWGYPRLARWSGQRRTLVFAFIAVATGLTIMPFGGSTLWIGLGFALAGGGTGIVIPALATLISNATPAPGQALGWQAAAANLGQAVAAAATGVLYAATPTAPFLVTAAVLVTGALVASRT